MARRIPPLNPLRAFEAAARHLSFTKAAEELFVTPGAISRSVRVLENYLDRALFERATGGLVLTHGSAEYASALTEALARIEEASEDFLELTGEATLSVRAYTSFLMHWLVPRLPAFREINPGIEVRFVAANDRVPFSWDGSDVRIRYGRGRWPDTESVPLFADELVPVCAPSLLVNVPAGKHFLEGQTLLSSKAKRFDWADWRKAAGVADVPVKGETFYEELSVAYHAAIAGRGIAIAQRAYIGDLLTRGLLVEPSDFVLTRDEGYYLTYHPSRADVQKIVRFRQWISRTLKQEGNRPPLPAAG